MRRSLPMIMIVLLVGLWGKSTRAQNTSTAQPGDPPIPSLITISAPDQNGIVTLTGAAGAVYPAAQVAIRNLYTEDTVYTQAGITGSFTASLYGPGNTPFWISPTASVPNTRRDQPGSLPGGPGTIIYGPIPELSVTQSVAITQLILDGNTDDWDAYNDITLTSDVYALVNMDSIYVAILQQSENYTTLQINFSVNGNPYQVTFDPRVYVTGVWQELITPVRDLGTIAVSAEVAENIEIRIPIAPIRQRLFNSEITAVEIQQITFMDADSNTLNSIDVTGIPVPLVEEENGIVYLNRQLSDNNLIRFSVSGSVAQGASHWHSRVRINQRTFQPGDDLIVEMDTTINAPALPETLVGLKVIGQFGLQRVIDENNRSVSSSLHTNNGWSSLQTRGGLAIDNVFTEIVLGEITVTPAQIIRKGENLLLGMSGTLTIPDDLPAGYYVPYFVGYGQIGDGERFRWSDNGLLGEGDGISRVPLTRLPIVFDIGMDGIESPRLLWTLFQDNPSNGSRGIIALEDRSIGTLSNRVKFNSPTYIIPPTDIPNGQPVLYPLEPYLINMLPNDYDSTTAPLLPLQMPSGRINVSVMRPDGQVDNLNNTSILQNRLSLPLLDDSVIFGRRSQVDVYRLTTLNDLFAEHVFDQYGEYIVEMTGFVEDIWGNRYEGGGRYPFLVAHLLDIEPAVLPGTPFEVGDTLNLGLHISPGVAADVGVRVRIFPLDGSPMIEQTLSGKANKFGVFQPDTALMLDIPAEYIVDYEVRFTDDLDRLWAGSMRNAGVIGTANNTLIAHGQRGVANYFGDYTPAWFFGERYTDIDSEQLLMFPPYHIGDVLWTTNAPTTGILARVRLQDTVGQYANWLIANHPDYVSDEGRSFRELNTRDALPNVLLGEDSQVDITSTPDHIVNQSYTYTSMVRPGVSLRQFIAGSESTTQPLIWNPTDPINGQIGAGYGGVRPDDYFFMFGGAVVHNDAINLHDAAIYASLGIVVDEDSNPGARVFPPYRGAAGGEDGGRMFSNLDPNISMFFHPTGIRPGDVLRVGDTLSVTGQIAPTLPSNVNVTVTSPSGVPTQFSGIASSIGYFYAPENDMVVDEIGVWTVNIQINHTGLTSVGVIDPAYIPTGDVLGSQGGRFNVYVVPADHDKLLWTQPEKDIAISAGFPFNFAFDIPVGWTDVRGYVTATLPQIIVEDGAVNVQGSLRYQYNPTNINQRFPFFEGTNGQIDGIAASDPLTLTFVLTGIDDQGSPNIRVRQVLIRHDRLTTID